MEKIGNKWVADEGTLFVRISDNRIMGDTLFLGEDDSIDNYREQTFTEEERKEFEEQYSFGGDGLDGTPGGTAPDE